MPTITTTVTINQSAFVSGTVNVANARLRASDGGVGFELGFYVTVSGNTVASGAPNAGGGGGPGAVYVFGR